MKLTKAETTARADFETTLRSAQEKLEDAVSLYNTTLNEVAEFISTVKDRLQEEFDNKSEGWQQGEKGQAAADFISSWENFNAEEADLQVDHAEEFTQLPSESE